MHDTPEPINSSPSSHGIVMVNTISGGLLQQRTVHGDTDTNSDRTHAIASVRANSRLIRLSGHVNKYGAVMMVDSGSTGDFISEVYVKQHKLPVKSYHDSKTVWLADGTQHVVREYTTCRISIGGLTESLELAIIPLVGYDVVLGVPWLQRHNPDINWTSYTISVNSCGEQYQLPLVGNTESPPV